jgi:hypothetical protein
MKLSAFWTVLAAIVLAGCTNNMVSKAGLTYNDGLAESFNSLILANIVRSAKGFPTYYSAIGDFSGSVTRTKSLSPQISADFDFLSGTNVQAGIDLEKETDDNVSVSSLETSDFATSMHAPLSPGIFEALSESRDRRHLHLTLILMLELVVISEDDLAFVLGSARANCAQRFDLLSQAYRGICRFITEDDPPPGCYDRRSGTDEDGNAIALIRLLNDPTNVCRYATFRLFVEALTIEEPHVVQEDDKTIVSLGSIAPGRQIFNEGGTGLSVRTPHEVIAYLGQIAEESLDGGGSYIRLSNADGQGIPVFRVEEGGRGPVMTKVSGVSYSVPEAGDHFTFRAMAIVKDIISLNTSQTQLPRDRTIFIGGPFQSAE